MLQEVGSNRGVEMMNEAQLERFMKEFHIDSVTGCWLWDGRTSDLGFGMFDLGGGFHSYAIEIARAEWSGVPVPPQSLPLDMTWRVCLDRRCVCPDPDHKPHLARRAFNRRMRRALAEGIASGKIAHRIRPVVGGKRPALLCCGAQ